MMKQIIRVLICVMVILQVSTSLWAAVNYEPITDIGSSARAIRLGNIEGWSESADGLFENPASLHRIDSFSFSGFQTQLFQEIGVHNYALAYRTQWGVFAVGVQEARVDGFESTAMVNDRLESVSSFDYRDSVWKLAYASSVTEHLHVGSNVSLYHREFTIDDFRAQGSNIDAGLIYTAYPVKLAATWKNILGNNVDFDHADDASEELGRKLVFSAKYTRENMDYFAQLNLTDNQGAPLKHLAYQIRPLETLSFSIGYKEFHVLKDLQRSVAIGMGLDLDGILLNYAYEQSDYKGHSADHFFSFAFNFDIESVLQPKQKQSRYKPIHRPALQTRTVKSKTMSGIQSDVQDEG